MSIKFLESLISHIEMLQSQYYLENTKDGIILNSATLKYLSLKEKEDLEKIVNCYKKAFKENLHSLYVRGSFITKRPHPIHDIDSFAILKKKIRSEDEYTFKNLINSLSTEIGVKVDDSTIDLNTLRTDPGVGYYRSFELKTQSYCVYGETLATEIEDFIISKDLAQKIIDDIPALLVKAELKFAKSIGNEAIKKTSGWLMKRLIRNSYLLILDKVNRFTRDINTSVLKLSEYFPTERDMFCKMGTIAVYTIGNIDEIQTVIIKFSKWYSTEYTKFMSTDNENSI